MVPQGAASQTNQQVSSRAHIPSNQSACATVTALSTVTENDNRRESGGEAADIELTQTSDQSEEESASHSPTLGKRYSTESQESGEVTERNSFLGFGKVCGLNTKCDRIAMPLVQIREKRRWTEVYSSNCSSVEDPASSVDGSPIRQAIGASPATIKGDEKK